METVAKDKYKSWFIYTLIAMVIFLYLRPQELYLSFLSPLKLPGITLMLMVFIFLSNSKDYLKEELAYKLMIAFWLLVSISIFYAVNTRAAYGGSMQMLWILVGFVFPLAVIVNTIDRLFMLWKLWLVVHFLLALTVIQQGGVGPGGILRDENDVAAALVMSLPYFLYMFATRGIVSRKLRILALVFAAVVFLAIGVTASRGGMVGMVAMIGVMVLMSKRPVRNTSIIVLVILLVGGTVIASLPDAYVADMMNITNPEDDTRDERVFTWSIGWVMYLDNPFFGLGAGNFAWTNHFYYKLSPMWEPGRRFLGGRAAHSIYFTLLPELGTVGAIIFFSLVKIFYSRCQSIKRGLSQASDKFMANNVILLSRALLASMVGYLVAGAFISVLYYPFFWHLLGITLVAYRVSNGAFKDEQGNPIFFEEKNKRNRQVV